MERIKCNTVEIRMSNGDRITPDVTQEDKHAYVLYQQLVQQWKTDGFVEVTEQGSLKVLGGAHILSIHSFEANG